MKSHPQKFKGRLEPLALQFLFFWGGSHTEIQGVKTHPVNVEVWVRWIQEGFQGGFRTATAFSSFLQKNPRAHKNKIGIPPPPPQNPPPKKGNFTDMVFPAERTHFFQVSIKLAHPFPAPELRTQILRTRGFFCFLRYASHGQDTQRTLSTRIHMINEQAAYHHNIGDAYDIQYAADSQAGCWNVP